MSAAVAAALGALVPCALLLRERRRLTTIRESVLDAVHEVARPLAAVRLGIAVLEPGHGHRLDPELDRARSSLGALADAVAGVRRSGGEAFAVSDLVSEVAATWSLVAAGSGRRLDLRVDSDATVLGDRSKIAQAVVNLVANSLQHGRGAISLNAVDRPGGCRIEVRDEGRGARRPEDRRAGRGLRIVRRTAELHGGRLDLSRLGEGAVGLELPSARR